LSAITDVNLGDGREMSSRASRTAAIMVYPNVVLGMRRFVSKHFAAHGADQERECLKTCRSQFKGELLPYQRDVLNATNGRVRVLLFEAPFGHEGSLDHLMSLTQRSDQTLHGPKEAFTATAAVSLGDGRLMSLVPA
jgi:hypothetical protein